MLLFLDIDGVMVPAQSWKVPEILEDGFPAFSSRATQALNSLISEQTTIVLTTSHKEKFSTAKWRDIFARRNILPTRLISLPANSTNLSRKEEILNWLRLNPPEEPFVIIDDDRTLNDLPSQIKIKLVQTSPHIGLTEEHLTVISDVMTRQIATS